MGCLRGRIVPIIIILLVIVAAWYALAVYMKAAFQRDLDRRVWLTPGTVEFNGKMLS